MSVAINNQKFTGAFNFKETYQNCYLINGDPCTGESIPPGSWETSLLMSEGIQTMAQNLQVWDRPFLLAKIAVPGSKLVKC